MDLKTSENLKLLELNQNAPVLPYQGRIISKNGTCNIHHPQTRRERLQVFSFTKLVSYSWFFTIIIFLSTLLASWFLFGVLYWLICYSHGDFEAHNLPPHQKENNHKPCIYHVSGFSSCLLFSFETQHTLAYGIKATTEECPEGLFVNASQCIIGFIMQGFMAVVIFAKMTLPQLCANTLMFSNRAVICSRNGKLALMFRVGDMRKNHIINVKLRAFLIRNVKTLEGEHLLYTQTELKLQSDGMGDGLFFNWPIIVVHWIDSKSPLFYLAPNDLKLKNFEIVTVLEGTITSTGRMTQAKTSYFPDEILWSMKFQSLIEYNSYRNEYDVDFSKFNSLLPSSTPWCSAACYMKYKNMQHN